MKIEFAPADTSDIAPLIAFQTALIKTYEDLTAIDYPRVLAWMERKVNTHIAEYTRILCDGEIAGYFRFVSDGEEMELDDLYLYPTYRNRGIGTHVITTCAERTKQPITLCVFSRNTSAIRLYHRLRFEITDIISPTRCRMRRMPE